MYQQKDNIGFNIKQIEEERRNTLELISIVLILGLFLSYIASSAYSFFEKQEWGNSVFWIVLIFTGLLIALYIYVVILGPAKVNLRVPFVLFFNHRTETISIPKEIHLPSEIDIPFPILSRLYYDVYKSKTESLDLKNLDILDLQSTLLVDLIQFLLIKIYMEENIHTWTPINRIRTGPFHHAQYCSLKNKEYKFEELNSLSGNGFLKLLGRNYSLMVPPKTKIDFPSRGHLRLQDSYYEMNFRVFASSIQSMELWDQTRGVKSSWHRELTNGYKDTSALLFQLNFEFGLKKAVWRFISENNFPRILRPEYTIQDLCDWANYWFSLASRFFTWVDEDISKISEDELAVIVDEPTMTYQLIGGSKNMIAYNYKYISEWLKRSS
jgi:hypothetical protein